MQQLGTAVVMISPVTRPIIKTHSPSIIPFSTNAGGIASLLLGVGMGCIMPAMTAGVLTAASAQDAGVASGILNAARQVGGTLGVALMGALVQRFPEAGYRGSFLLTAAAYLVMGVFTGRLLTESPGRSPDSGSRRGLPESGTTRLKNGTSRGG